MVLGHLHLIIPLFGSIVWFGGLLAMIITWRAQGRPHYVTENGTIPFISDIGADSLKPLFIIICSITAVCFTLSLAIERWLRHSGRLLPNVATREKAFSGVAIFGATLGGVALILLSIFDTKRHHSLHRLFLLMFILGVSISAIFTVLEFYWLNKHFTKNPKIRRSYIAKAVIVTILIALAIAFGVTLDSKYNVAAVLEWVIAFGFTFYLLTFFFDLHIVRPVINEEARENLWRMHETG